MKFVLPLLLFFLSTSNALAFDLELFAGANTTTFDDAKDANSYGISVRTKLDFYGKANRGFFVNINAKGVSLLTADTLTGYAIRSSGPWFFEGGAGLGFSTIFGSGLGVLAGTGYNVTSTVFVNFPIILTNNGVFWSPYLGYKF